MMREGQRADHNTPPKRLSTVATSLDTISCMSPAFILQSRSTKILKQKVIDMRHTLNTRVSLQRRLHASVTTINPPLQPEPNSPNTRRITKVTPSSFSSSTFSLNSPPSTTIPHAVRNAINLATMKTIVPKLALFAFYEIDLICSPLSRTTSFKHNVFTASALTFPSPARCAMPRADTESQKKRSCSL